MNDALTQTTIYKCNPNNHLNIATHRIVLCVVET